MKNSNTKRNLLTVGAIVGIVALGGVATTANAASQVDSGDIKNQTIRSIDIASGGVGGSEIRNQSIHSVDIAANGVGKSEIREGAVGGSEVANGAITLADINDATEKALTDGLATEQYAQEKADASLSVALDGIGSVRTDVDAVTKQVERNQTAFAPLAADNSKQDAKIADLQEQVDGMGGETAQAFKSSFEFTSINVGGKFADRAKKRDVTIPAGSYAITTDALFVAPGGSPASVDLQVAVRGADGADLGTGFTGGSPLQAEREVTTSTTRIVTFAEDTTVTVSAFGYDADGQSSEGTGAYNAYVSLVAVPVNLAD